MQQHARVVIIGAGIVGCSVAYHLTQLGWRDIVVVEQGRCLRQAVRPLTRPDSYSR